MPVVPVPVPQKEVARLNHKSLRRPRIFLFGKSCVMRHVQYGTQSGNLRDELVMKRRWYNMRTR